MAGIAIAVLLAGCSSGAKHEADSSSETTITEAPSTTTTMPPTTTTAEVPTTVPPTTVPPKTTTTTIDPNLARFYAQFGGKRETGKVLPNPHGMVATTRCTTVPGGWGVAASNDWSDGFTEFMNSDGPFTVSTKHVAAGARGTTVDIVINGPNCSVVVHDPSRE